MERAGRARRAVEVRILAVVVVWGRVVAIWSGDLYEGGPSEAPAGVLCYDGTVQTQLSRARSW